MRIGIDARFYGPGGQGLGRYVERLLLHLSQIDTKNTYYVFVRSGIQSLTLPKNFKLIFVRYHWYSWSEQLGWPLFLACFRLDLMHFTHFNVPVLYPGAFIVTIHDLILFHYPSAQISTRNWLHFRIKYLAFRLIIRSAIFRARRVVTVSNFSSADICNYFPQARKKIMVIYEGVGYSETSSRITEDEEGVRERLILYVGNAYPHKNLSFLISNFGRWQKTHEGYRLCLVGRKDLFYSRLMEKAAKHTSAIDFAGEVTDEELTRLYRSASVYVFPSLYEGFGLPGLEAMSNGLPVLSSSTGALQEIFGDAATYFNPADNTDFTKKLSLLVDTIAYRSTIVRAGYERVKKYSWRSMAKSTYVLYDEMKK